MPRIDHSPINVGIVGYGYAGRAFHSYLVGLTEGLRLGGISTRSLEAREQAVRDLGIRVYEQPSQLFGDPEIDLVVLATPHDTHRVLAVEALQAGKHVVTDKVMAITVDECTAMIEAARRADRFLTVFHNRRWDGDFLTIQRLIDSGLLGRILSVEAGIFGYGTPRSWRGRRSQMGGIMYDWGAHLVDQALLLARSPVEWVSGVSQFENPDCEIESWARCTIRFQNGLLYTVEISNRARLGKPRWYICGERGSLLKDGLDPQEGFMNRKEIEKARWLSEHNARVRTEIDGIVTDMNIETQNGDWRNYYRNVADVLLRDAEPAVKPEEVRRAVAVIESSVRSAETGEIIHFNEDGLPIH